jgi:conflict system STAND superfamily ATPase
MSPANGGANDAVMIDPENPWLGLFSYSEETRAYFHGRDEEAAELARRVQRKLLTVLFGQSGLGKTSLLRAGIVPRLRAEGYCPVYVRVDYAPESPPPSEQIKQAIFRATSGAGFWTQPGTAIEGESLWEFLHHRGDLLRDAEGHTLLPLLIFDQFEEIFTLAQADDAGRIRAKQFLEDLADLVENRPPAALEARLEHDDNAAESFDFARADYRILIALREDYLAHLEGVKSIMPSITQNRMRLARMTGAQALSAVVKPGGRLVSQEVAESIVRFVAGGSELANAEIEPSLLSLVCRELNTVRQAQKRGEISADLLAGSRETILTEFYERTLADQPAGVRRVIEDDLLTESGYRESLAEERVLKALAAVGAASDSLATLVNRRLLRIEERLDMRRVELTHDVLCGVVLSSRNLRHEREARDDAERLLAAQHEREIASHRALVRARMVAGVCAVLMVLAAASAVFGWINLRRARVADAEAQKSRVLAEGARGDAEKLVAFLIEDFYKELEPTGQLDTLGKLAHMTVGYYDGLPAELITPQTQIFRAMALVREGAARNARGDVDAAYKNLGEAQAALEKLQASGDNSEAVTLGLALALFNQGESVLFGGRGTVEQLNRAADLLRPLVYGPQSSRQVKQTYVDTLNILSHMQPQEIGVATCEEARKILVGLGAKDLSDLNAASAYADVADSEARHLFSLGRVDEAKKLEQEVYDMTEKVLLQRPSDLRSLANRYFAADLLGRIAERQHDDATATDYGARSIQAGEDNVRFNPSDLNAWGYWIAGFENTAAFQLDRGEVAHALNTMHAMMGLAQNKRRPSSLAPLLWFRWGPLAILEAQNGDSVAAEKSLQGYKRDIAEAEAKLTENDPRHPLFATGEQTLRARLQLIDGDTEAAFTAAASLAKQIEQIEVPVANSNAVRQKNNLLRTNYTVASVAAIRLGRYAQAEAFARLCVPIPIDTRNGFDATENISRVQVILAHAIATQGRTEEARTALQSAMDYYQREQQTGAHGTQFRRDFAYALYVSAIAQSADAAGRVKRDAELTEAAKQLDGASTEAKRLSSTREVGDLIAAKRASSAN